MITHGRRTFLIITQNSLELLKMTRRTMTLKIVERINPDVAAAKERTAVMKRTGLCLHFLPGLAAILR